MQVEPVERRREKIAEVMDRVSQLAENVGSHQVDLAGAPQRFQRGHDPLADPASFAVGVFRILVADQLLVERAVAFADRCPFRFGRVGGQHRLDIHVRQHRQDFLRAESHRPHVAQRARPQSADRFRAENLFALPADCGGHPFLDHVEQLETDRIKLLGPFRGMSSGGGGARPREKWKQLVFAQAFQRVAEASHEK